MKSTIRQLTFILGLALKKPPFLHRMTKLSTQKATRHTALNAVSVPSRQDFKQELQFKNVAKTGQIPNRVRNDDSF